MKTTKKKLLILLTLAILPAALLLLPAFAAAPSIPPARPASQAETDAGTISNKFVSPATLAGYSLAQSTGSISAATATNIANYAALIATNKLSNDLRTNATFWTDGTAPFLRIDSTGDTLLDYGNAVFQGTSDGLYSAAGIASGLGFEGNGESITNLDGANIQASTINSNKFDAATLAKLYEASSGTQTNISAAAVTNAGTAIWSNATAFVLSPTNSGTDGQIVSLTGNKTKWIDDATAAGGLATVATNALLYTTNVAARYDTNTIRISTGDQSNPDAWFDTIGSAGSVTPHFSVGGATAWWDFNLPVTNADVVHFSSVVVMDPDNVVFGAGTLALATATATTPAENDNDTSVATTAYVQTEIAGISGSTALWFTNPVAATSISNAYNTKIEGNLDVTGTNSSGTANITNMYLVGRASALALIESDGQLETNSVGTAVPINADGTQTSFANLQTGTARTITTNNATLTSGRVQVGDGGRGVANATASGAVPIDADGTATTFAQVNALAPANIVTNGSSPSLLTVTADGFDLRTNSWTINGVLYLGTNATYTGGAATIGITGVGGTIGSAERFGSLTIKSTGDIVFTNPAAFYASDGADSRTFTNGNLTVLTVQVIPGFSTNLIWSWSK